MKVCITSTAPGMEAHVDPRLEGAAFFTIVDTEKMTSESVPNHLRDLPVGAEEETAKACIGLGAEVLISEHVSPKAQEILSRGGMKYYPYAGGMVESAIEQLKRGELLTQPELDKLQDVGGGVGRGSGIGTGPEAVGQGYKKKG